MNNAYYDPMQDNEGPKSSSSKELCLRIVHALAAIFEQIVIFFQAVRQNLINWLCPSTPLIDDYQSLPSPFQFGRMCGFQHGSLNRNRRFLPFKDNRVILNRSVEGVDYINASRVRLDGVEYICTQAPLDTSVPHFYQMLAQESKEGKIRLAKVTCSQEGYAKKCALYWGGAISEEFKRRSRAIDIHHIAAEGPDCEEKDIFDRKQRARILDRSFSFQAQDKVNVKMVDLYNWPDSCIKAWGGVSVDAFKEMVSILSDPKEHSPIVIHCTAGVGRTGTLLLALAVFRHAREHGIRDAKNIRSLMKRFTLEMRNQRTHLLQTRDQYSLVFQAVMELLNN